jgi:16S rRNA (cytosine967-C5)-methyltransferase
MGEALENRAAHVLRLVGPGVPADAALRGYLSGRAGLREGEGRQVSRAVFSYYRWLGWLDPDGSAQARIAAALAMQERFERDPGSVKAEALGARAVPAWLAQEMDLPPQYLRSLQSEPALWIRAKVAGLAAVVTDLGSCAPPALPAALAAPPGLAALRYTGAADLHRTAGYRSGAFEIQDLSSQLVGHACRPEPGETWWDACAGEGGKTLHLGDLMRNKGLVWATDRSQRRLAALKRRAARAGMFNYRCAAWSGTGRAPFGAPCNGVLVDAPCSGVGTWQRNPHARWTTSQEDVRELASVQAALLLAAARAVKPGGRLVYSVCTLTRSETTAVADGFGASHPGFEPWPLPIAAAPGACRLALWPQDLDSNGMFLAAWKRVR